ncbi:Protein of unknown function [Bacillus wiedmannii]|nr:Protein of unknown function [Bacillus wiedmannii]
MKIVKCRLKQLL